MESGNLFSVLSSFCSSLIATVLNARRAALPATLTAEQLVNDSPADAYLSRERLFTPFTGWARASARWKGLIGTAASSSPAHI